MKVAQDSLFHIASMLYRGDIKEEVTDDNKKYFVYDKNKESGTSKRKCLLCDRGKIKACEVNKAHMSKAIELYNDCQKAYQDEIEEKEVQLERCSAELKELINELANIEERIASERGDMTAESGVTPATSVKNEEYAINSYCHFCDVVDRLVQLGVNKKHAVSMLNALRKRLDHMIKGSAAPGTTCSKAQKNFEELKNRLGLDTVGSHLNLGQMDNTLLLYFDRGDCIPNVAKEVYEEFASKHASDLKKSGLSRIDNLEHVVKPYLEALVKKNLSSVGLDPSKAAIPESKIQNILGDIKIIRNNGKAYLINSADKPMMWSSEDRNYIEVDSVDEAMRGFSENRHLIEPLEKLLRSGKSFDVSQFLSGLKNPSVAVSDNSMQKDALEAAPMREVEEFKEEKLLEAFRKDKEKLILKELKHLSDELQLRIDTLSGKITEVESCLEKGRTKLSALASSKLLDNNPNITDLSDQNRPTKIAELYTELYDNQWTDAFEMLDNKKLGGGEKDSIQKLYDALVLINKEASKEEEDSSQQLSRAYSDLFNSKNIKDDKELCVALAGARKKVTYGSIEIRTELLLNKVNSKLEKVFGSKVKDHKALKEYCKECAKIACYANCQDPPVVLAEAAELGAHFDGNRYKAYTKTGKKYEYVVWPPLLLHKGGPMLVKGVAQGDGSK